MNTIFVFLISFSVFTFTISENLHPIIFVPGDGGSQVEAKLNKTSVVHYICEKTSDYANIWLNIELLVPIVIDCFIDNLKLTYDNTTRTTKNSPGVDIRIPGFGSSEVVEWIDPSHASAGAYFKDIGNILVQDHGYVRNVSLRGAPYDFRKGPNELGDYFKQLKSLIEETYILNNKQSVIIIAHSMGAPLFLIFLHSQEQAWKDKYIKTFVTLAGAWGGSVKAIKVFAIGDDLGAFMLRQKILREEQITSPSLSWLLPSSLFWKENEVLVQTETKNYTVNDYEEFFKDLQYPVGWEMRKDTQNYTLNFAAPGVEVHCLYGSNLPTVERLNYKKSTVLDGSPTLINGDGDGTVNLRSLEACKFWKDKQSQRVYSQKFPNAEHMLILSNPNVLSYITQLVTKIGYS
ncbi:phospholipase A2 group XV-like isoform X2 [Chrysoperla carnea]|uniref:phospholipase A2 group XV-like isoform X2 n=1 Tax=Chrysoperla carnea TaxID=189513 RepID=UPI001D089B95|nr:phospholipase A2 group XV-like isoform X2 [Chrysoperla carnea]